MKSLETGSNFHDELLGLIAEAEAAQKDDNEKCAALRSRAASMVVQAEAHTDALKGVRKKVAAFLKAVM